jgi:hypothetical protein
VRGPVRCRKMPGPGGWNASRISASSQGDWHDGRRSGPFLHLLVQSCGQTHDGRGDGGTILALAVKSTSHAREARGA